MGIPSFALAICVVFCGGVAHAGETPNPERDILVTFVNDAARSSSAGLGAPYQHRRKYSIARNVRRNATAIAREFSLQEVEHWPIRSLSIYCFVYRPREGADRDDIIALLGADARVESAQLLHSFETSLNRPVAYDDTYANLQYALEILDIAAAHQMTRGADIRIAIIDSHVDKNHEDLRGRIDQVRVFSSKGVSVDEHHGTAVASVIGARSDNALGIVGIAPEATLELYVSCWRGGASRTAVCDSFSISKALDSMLQDPPHVLNLSLSGPHDLLLERLINKASEAGVVVVAARPAGAEIQESFPSNMQHVIGVGATPIEASAMGVSGSALLAPGNRILVAVPTDQYDFRSGSSLAAAHVSGVVALLLSVAPDHSPDSIRSILQRSQVTNSDVAESINACDALNLASSAQHCGT